MRFQSKLITAILFIAFIGACTQPKPLQSNNDGGNKSKIKLKSLDKFLLKNIQNEQKLAATTTILTTLSSDKFEGRKPGTPGFKLCAEYVESFLSKNNIQPFFDKGYKDPLQVKGEASYNIVGLIGERDNKKEHIMICAHLDHLGKSTSATDSVFNGANDNASGVTAVLQVSQQLAKYQFEQNIIVVLFTGEESGLIGSKHLAKKLKAEGLNLSYLMNFEMIGKTLSTGKDQVYITGYNKSNCAKEMNKIADRTFVNFLQAEISYQLFSRSDNFPFYAEFKIPSHTISTFDFKNYNHYHKESDEVDELDVDNMNKVINTSTFIIGEMLKNKTVLSMNKK